MKEIIRPGNGGIKIKYNNTCPYCHCEYTYEADDVFTDYSLAAIAYVTCPSCGGKNLAAILPPLTHISRIYDVFYDCPEAHVHTLFSDREGKDDNG